MHKCDCVAVKIFHRTMPQGRRNSDAIATQGRESWKCIYAIYALVHLVHNLPLRLSEQKASSLETQSRHCCTKPSQSCCGASTSSLLPLCHLKPRQSQDLSSNQLFGSAMRPCAQEASITSASSTGKVTKSLLPSRRPHVQDTRTLHKDSLRTCKVMSFRLENRSKDAAKCVCCDPASPESQIFAAAAVKKVSKTYNRPAKDMKASFASPPCAGNIPTSQPTATLRTPQDASEALATSAHPVQTSQGSCEGRKTSLNRVSSAALKRAKQWAQTPGRCCNAAEKLPRYTSRATLPVGCVEEREACTAGMGSTVGGLERCCEHLYELCILI